MSSKQKVIGGVVGAVVVLLVGGSVYAWMSNAPIRKVADLQNQLLNANDLSKDEFNALKLNLMRTVDSMPREKVREMYEQIGEQRREQDKQNMDEFFALGSDAEKERLLGRVIEEKQRSRDIQGALRTKGVYRRRKMTEEDKGRMEQAKKIKTAMDAGELTQEQAMEKFKALRGKREDSRPKMSEEELAAREEQRRLQDEFNQALAAHAEQIGVEWQRERGRGRGQFGGGRGGARTGGRDGGGQPGGAGIRRRGTQS